MGLVATGLVIVYAARGIDDLDRVLQIVGDVKGLAIGGEGQGLFAANYRAAGSAADPKVSVNPLSALTPGFLRRLFQPNFGIPPPVQESLGTR